MVAAELKVGFIDGSQCHLEPRTWAEAKLSQKTMLPTLIAVAAACRYSVDSHWERLTKQQKRATIEERVSETILEKRDDLFPAIRLMRTENSEQRGMPAGLQSQVTEPLENVRDVRNSTRGFPILEAITEVDSLHTGTRAAHDEGFCGTY